MFYGDSVVRAFAHNFFFYCRSVSPWWPLASRRYKISCCSSNRQCLLCFLCLALAPFLVELRWPVALLSLFLCLSFSLYSKFVDLTINLSLILKTTQIQKHFPLSVFVFIDSLVVSASQDAGGHTLSRQNNLTFGIGLHVVGVRTVVRTLRHNQIFSDGYVTKFSYLRCFAGALRARELRYEFSGLMTDQ